MSQIARNLTDCFDGFLLYKRYLIYDCDPLFTKQFRDILEAADVESIRLLPKSPNLNSFSERFVHQGVGNKVLKGRAAAHSDKEIVRHQRLGGMLKYDSRQGA